jgi:hypothetical protein
MLAVIDGIGVVVLLKNLRFNQLKKVNEELEIC